jgi:hypothetical protein
MTSSWLQRFVTTGGCGRLQQALRVDQTAQFEQRPHRDERLVCVDQRVAAGRVEHPCWNDTLNFFSEPHQPQSFAEGPHDFDDAIEVKGGAGNEPSERSVNGQSVDELRQLLHPHVIHDE